MFCNKLIKQTVISVLTSLLLCFNSCKDGRPKAVLLDFELNTHLQLIQDGKTGSARVRLRQHMVSRGETSQPLFLMGLSYHLDKQYSKAARWFSYSINAEGPSYPQA